MKVVIIAVLIILVLASVFSAIGCKAIPSNFGEPITETQAVSIRDILAQPNNFISKVVRIEGRVMEECPAGGWFMLKDNTGVIFVNLHPSSFSIPQVSGRQVIAEGIVNKEGTQISVVGKGVQLK